MKLCSRAHNYTQIISEKFATMGFEGLDEGEPARRNVLCLAATLSHGKLGRSRVGA